MNSNKTVSAQREAESRAGDMLTALFKTVKLEMQMQSLLSNEHMEFVHFMPFQNFETFTFINDSITNEIYFDQN